MLLHNRTEIISTERVILRRFELHDAYAMFKNWANDCNVTKFLSWEPHNNWLMESK